MAELVVVIEVVARRDAEHPLTDQRRHRMLDQAAVPRVVKARRQAPRSLL